MLLEQEWAKTHSCLLSQVITNKSVLCHAAEWKVSLTRPAAGVGIPASRILFQVCYRDEDVASDNTDN